MAELKPGETLLLAGGTTATVSSCRVEHLTQPVAIYNFEVADWHTYHVGSSTAGWVWVHNKTCAYDVALHRDMPSPRPNGLESHHGVLDAWMASNFKNYRTGNAPAILLPRSGHNATRGLFNRWRREIAIRQGVPSKLVDWRRVSAGEVWKLAEESFDLARVPAAARAKYWSSFNKFLETLK